MRPAERADVVPPGRGGTLAPVRIESRANSFAHPIIRRAVICAPFVACIALYAPAMSGYFLSDDMSVLFVVSGLQQKGHLWMQLFHKFSGGLDAQSNYYRPLTFLSFGLDFALFGLESRYWHLVNLAGHLAAGAAIYRICRLLQPDPRDRWTAPFAAALFLLCGTNVEAVAWISGRYDVFATALLLWAGALYLRSRTSFDAFESGAWLCGILALACKESAALLPALIACVAWVKHAEVPASARLRALVRDLLPWAAMIGGYFALRLALFGSMFQVYPGTDPLQRIQTSTWLPGAAEIWAWLIAALPNEPALVVVLAGSAILLAIALRNALRDPALRRPLLAILAALALSLAMLLPHLSGLSARGEGGRLFYSTTALSAIFLAIGSGRYFGPFGAYRRAAVFLFATATAMLVAHSVLLDAALRPWRNAGAQMRMFVATIPELRKSVAAGGYALVIAPDAIGPAPFARNAQGAIVIPPVQREWLLNAITVYLPARLPDLPGRLQQQMIPVLQRLALNAAGDRIEDPHPGMIGADALWPTDMFCWNVNASAVRRFDLPRDRSDPARWLSALSMSARTAGCDYVPSLVPSL
ncbi:MAG: hypothetical protein ABIS68_08335 [Casimicrobiaceae bacterium]